MPTAARLVAAVVLGITALVVSVQIQAAREQVITFRWFMEYNTLLGGAVGWLVIGTRVGHGLRQGVAAGVTGGIAFVVLLFMSHGAREMIRRSFRKYYDGAIEALVAVAQIATEDFIEVAVGSVLLPLFVGAILAGIAANAAARRWK